MWECRRGKGGRGAGISTSYSTSYSTSAASSSSSSNTQRLCSQPIREYVVCRGQWLLLLLLLPPSQRGGRRTRGPRHGLAK